MRYRILMCALLCQASLAAAAPDACADLATAADGGGDALLLPSFIDEKSPALVGAAFTYDNAVAAIALVACGDTRAARRIGDALLLALEHDRHWHDGRLRNGYAAGVPADPFKLTGWWDGELGRWLEDDYQAGSDSGNLAWAMLALLTVERATGDARYRQGALRLARWLEQTRDGRGAGGFRGGFTGHEPQPAPVQWKSTEHNIDLAAAFALLALGTRDRHWQQRSAEAAAFVAAMWNDTCGCYATGTGTDGVTINPLLATDAQVWALLALPQTEARRRRVVDTVQQRLSVAGGITYSEARGGIWTEGSAHMALLLRLLHQDEVATRLVALVEAQRAAGGGYFASDVASLPTGFVLSDGSSPRFYFHQRHLGATAWAALAERGFNPFLAAAALPPS
jgi:hypothetical protein